MTLNPYTLYQKALQTPGIWRWLMVVLTVGYILMPIDLMPELFIPPFGLIDDGVLLTVFVSEIVRMSRNRKLTKKTPTDPETVQSQTIDANKQP